MAAGAAFIGECAGTSNILAGMQFGIPVYGTMAHSFITSFESEIMAFKDFQRLFPDGFLLIDTFDTLNAIKMIIKERILPKGVRIDSGDLLYLSKKVRELLDAAVNKGYRNTEIMISGDLNESIIKELLENKAPVDSFTVGTELSTSQDSPVINCVHKLVAIRVLEKDKSDLNSKDIKLHAGIITADIDRMVTI